jgi:hypothetical protein
MSWSRQRRPAENVDLGLFNLIGKPPMACNSLYLYEITEGKDRISCGSLNKDAGRGILNIKEGGLTAKCDHPLNSNRVAPIGYSGRERMNVADAG